MKIAIIGLGYVGAVTGSALCDMGNHVTLVDRDERKVELLNNAQSPIAEPGLKELIVKGVSTNQLVATTSVKQAGLDCDLVMISVGTPTDYESGAPDLTAVRRVSEDLAQAISERTTPLLVAVSSTVPPGTTETLVRPILEAGGKNAGKYFLCFIPEFLREGTAIDDFRYPTRFVVGASSKEEAAEFGVLRSDIPEKHHYVDTSVAEMLKTTENCWHATKVTFANEVERVAQAYNVDAQQVMDLLLKDNKQNVSTTYMRPGFAYGGSCLPKDLRSMVRLGQVTGVSTPMLAGISASNRDHVDSALSRIVAMGKPRIGILGLAFKADTDDLRESPAVDLIELLVGKGFAVNVHDYEAHRHPAFGANLNEWNRHAHLEDRMIESTDELIAGSDVIVLTQFNRRYLEVVANLPAGIAFIDLAGLTTRP
jgi:GDP-mannose 6-dehydrogenase